MVDLGVDRTELTCIIKGQQDAKRYAVFIRLVQEREKQRDFKGRVLTARAFRFPPRPY